MITFFAAICPHVKHISVSVREVLRAVSMVCTAVKRKCLREHGSKGKATLTMHPMHHTALCLSASTMEINVL